MNQKQVFYIDGSAFNSRKSFRKVIKESFCFEDSLNLKNWNVLQDALYGGYGCLNYREDFTLIWQNFKKSQHKLSENELEEILTLLTEMDHITLVLD